MAGVIHRALFFLYLSCLSYGSIFSNPTNISLNNVSGILFKTAINALNENSPTHHKYKAGNLINAQKVVEPPYVIYRLTFNLNPICDETVDPCPREACTINLREHELGAIQVLRDSIQCMYLYPQSTQDNVQDLQEIIPDNLQETELLDSLDKQIVNNGSVELDHEVQTAGDQNDKPFIAVRASQSNYCPGCPYELNPSLPGLVAFGEQVVKSMDDTTNSDYKYKVMQIMKVTRTVPPSSNAVQYHILLEIGETNCLKNIMVERAECSVQPNIPSKICLVTFEVQPWQQDSRRIKSNNCTQIETIGNEVNANIKGNIENVETSYNNEQQSTMMIEEATYSQTTQENKEEAYEHFKDMLLENVTYETTTDTADRQKQQPIVTEEPIIRIVLNGSVEDQRDIDKFVDKRKEFDEFLEDFDIPTKTDGPKSTDTTNGVPVIEEVIIPKKVGSDMATKTPTESLMETTNVFDKNVDVVVENFERIKRSDRISREKNLINELAEKAISTLDDIDGDNKKRMVAQVLDSTRDKFNKSIYNLKMEIVNTDCSEDEKDIKKCLPISMNNAKICHMLIHTDEDDPLNNPRVIKSECHATNKNLRRAKRGGLVGSPNQADVNDPEIKKYAELGLNKFSQLSESTYEPVIVEITEASAQVVSGMLYKIKVKLGSSNCPKGQKQNCQLQEGTEIKNCLITIWSQPWIDHGYPDVKVDCGSSQTRKKRSLRGMHYSEKMLKQAQDLKEARMFEEFIQDQQKTYSSEKERNYRFKVFRKNLRIIETLEKNEQGTAKYGVNMFADLTPEEFRSRYLGLRPELRRENEIPFPQAEIPRVVLPKEFDWRHYNIVTPVKDQGQCGSCWAFSVTGNIEGQYALKHKKLLSLSEQELIDCDKYDDGCNGGLPDTAYRAIESLGGLELESDYPYRAEDEKCHFDKREARVRVISAVNITSDESKMAQWLVENGPIAIGINANAMQFYMGGISHPLKYLCNPNDLDHGVLIVGYGVHTYPLFHKTLPYWTIKNSWGPRWGEQGYYRVFRGDGTCGLNMMASSAVVL